MYTIHTHAYPCVANCLGKIDIELKCDIAIITDDFIRLAFCKTLFDVESMLYTIDGFLFTYR